MGDHVTLGGMSGVSQFVRIGDHAYVGGQSGVDKDVPPFVIAFGSRPCEIKSANIVGLRRRGFSDDAIRQVNKAIKLWARADVSKDQCLREIEAECGDWPEVTKFVEFIRKSESGVIR